MKTILAAFLVIAVMGAVPLAAQGDKKGAELTRSVIGTVTIGDSAPAAGAVVYLKNLKSLEVRTFYAKDTGEYRFSGLSPDIDYELHAELQGKKSPTRNLSSFNTKKQAVINLKLPESAKK